MDIAILKMNERSNTTYHAQLIEQITEAFTAGKIKPGERLPTTRQMGAALGLHFNTVARAYRALEEMGYLVTRQGRGTSALSPALADAPEDNRVNDISGQARQFVQRLLRAGHSAAEVENALAQALEELKRRAGE